MHGLEAPKGPAFIENGEPRAEAHDWALEFDLETVPDKRTQREEVRGAQR